MSSVMDKALAMTERMVKARDEARAERDAARADLAEALKALEGWLDGWEGSGLTFALAERTRAILSKHAKPDGGAT